MRKILFIKCEGALVEPNPDQINDLQQLEFLPGVFRNLSRIAKELDYQFVLITNTNTSIEINSKIVKKIIKAFKNEDIDLKEISHYNLYPGAFPFVQVKATDFYLDNNYDVKHSYFICDKLEDTEMAGNLSLTPILISETLITTNILTKEKWDDVYYFLKDFSRSTIIKRITSETNIFIELNLDGSGKSSISTGLGFLDHMLDQVARHGNVDLSISVNGDLHIDEHHTIEDVGLALGEAFFKALGNKKGIERYGFLLPMDDCLAQVAIDFGGRSWLVWEADFKREKIGDVPTEMFYHFFKSFSDTARCNLNIKAEGNNEHHKIEAIFKAFAKAINMAIRKTGNNNIPSTKGSL